MQCCGYSVFTIYHSLNSVAALPRYCQFGVNTTIELKEMTTISENTGTLVSCNITRRMPLLSDVVVISLSSIVVLTPNEQFLGCATIAFSERYGTYNVISPS